MNRLATKIHFFTKTALFCVKKCEVYPFVKPNMPIEFCSLVLKGRK